MMKTKRRNRQPEKEKVKEELTGKDVVDVKKLIQLIQQ